MERNWLAMEHYRLHVIEQWADGPRKEAALASARSSIASLTRTPGLADGFQCSICAAGRAGEVIAFPSRSVAIPERRAA